MSKPQSRVTIQLSQPYLDQAQIDALSTRSRSRGMNESTETMSRLAAGDLMQTLGRSLSFPCRTIGTSMMVWNRFHLDHAMSDYRLEEVAVAAVFVASKLEDTPRKAREVLIAAHDLRHPHGPTLQPESQALEEQRRRVLGLERMMLETESFDFRRSHAHVYTVKFARRLQGVPRRVARRAWDVCSDAYRTWLPFKLPAHVIGAASLCVAASLVEETECRIDLGLLRCKERDVDLAMVDLYDLYLLCGPRTLVGPVFGQDRLLELKARLNRRIGAPIPKEAAQLSGGGGGGGAQQPNGKGKSSPTKPFNITEAGDQGTCRFVLEEDRPRAELSVSLRG